MANIFSGKVKELTKLFIVFIYSLIFTNEKTFKLKGNDTYKSDIVSVDIT